MTHEIEIVKLIWNALLTVGGGLVIYFYNDIVKKSEKLNNKVEELQKELNAVKIEYVEKSEIQRIEQRIDSRFMEMREFIVQILDRNGK